LVTATQRAVTSVTIVALALAGCAGLTPPQDAGWQAFHACQQSSSSAALEDLQQGGRVNYRTQEGVDFSTMKACMEQRGYTCDLGVTIGSRPNTHCYPKAS
jgi:hypothetical protein